MFFKIIGFIKVVIEALTIVGPILKIPKLEKTIEVMSMGIEGYSKTAGNESEGKRVKAFIKATAQAADVEGYLNKKIQGYTKRQFKKLF